MKGRKLLLAWLAVASTAWAQLSPLDREVMEKGEQAMGEGRWIAVRQMAETRLERNPDDLMGLYLITEALNREGNSPRVYLYARKGQMQVEKMLKTSWTSDLLAIHQRFVGARFMASMEMGKYEESLAIIKQHDRLFEPKMEADAGWPLLKLGRLEECQKRMQKLIDKGDPLEQITAMNTLGSVAWQMGRVAESRRYFTRIEELSRAGGLSSDPVFLCNKGESELGLGNFKVAERDYLEASQNFNENSAANPWQILSTIYLDAGKFPRAVEATRKMHAWYKMCAPSVDNDSWATRRKQLAALLLASGYSEESLAILEELLHRPERNSNTSDGPFRLEAEVLLLYQDALQVILERSKEERSWSSLGSRIYLWTASLGRGNAYDDAQERVAGLVMEPDVLGKSLLPYQADAIAPPWLLPDLIEAVGPGVAAVEAQKMENASIAYFAPYLQAVQGEARMRQERYDEALPLLLAATKALPKEQVLLKARVQLCLAVVKERTGDVDGALEAYQSVLEVEPNMFRRLGVDMPVKFAKDSSGAADDAAEMLDASPRFREEDYGFVVELGTVETGLQARLLSPKGTPLFWATGQDTSELGVASRTCQALHGAVFAPRVKLEPSDIAAIQNAGPEALED